MAVSGDVLLVGSWANAAYIYAFDGRTWQFSEKIRAPQDTERYDDFGGSVAICGALATVGAPYQFPGRARVSNGSLYVFSLDSAMYAAQMLTCDEVSELPQLPDTTPAPATFLSTTLAPSTFFPITLAPSTFLPTAPAPSTFFPTTPAPSTFFPTTLAASAFLPTTLAPTTPPACAKPKGRENCEFYRGCLEARVACGPEGYALGFGEAYCEVFLSIEAETSDPDDKAWYSTVRACLQDALVPLVCEAQVPTCEDISAFAFNAHPDCYMLLDEYLCTDVSLIWNVVLSTSSEALREAYWSNVAHTLHLCFGVLFDTVYYALEEIGVELSEALGSILVNFEMGVAGIEGFVSDLLRGSEDRRPNQNGSSPFAYDLQGFLSGLANFSAALRFNGTTLPETIEASRVLRQASALWLKTSTSFRLLSDPEVPLEDVFERVVLGCNSWCPACCATNATIAALRVGKVALSSASPTLSPAPSSAPARPRV